MSRVLLISANTTIEPIPVYPLGLAFLEAALKAQGHLTRQFDLLYHREDQGASLEEALVEFQPQVVGISVRNIDNVDSMDSGDNWYLPRLKALVDEIRGVTRVPVVLGGPAFSIMPKRILDYSGADYGITGEGEQAFDALIRELEAGGTPPRITGADIPRLAPDEFSCPSYDPDLTRYYMDRSGMINYQTKRGCPFGCNYCTYPLIEGRKFRYQDPEFVVENLARLKADTGADSVFFTDSVFNDPQGRFLEIAQAMVRRNLGMKWAGYFRPDPIAQDDLRLLKASGLYAMEVGADAGCDTTLKGIGKNFDFSRILAFNEAGIKADIPRAQFFMFGGPGETRDTVEESLANIEGLRHTVVFAFSGIRILPRTGIADIARDQGIIAPDDALLLPRYYVSPTIDKEWMDQRLTQAFAHARDRFFPPEQGQFRLKALQAFGFKGLLWDMILNMPAPRRQRRPQPQV